jgi:hypothetical protein
MISFQAFTPTATDTFNRPNENPLNPAHWTTPSGFAPMEVFSDSCCGSSNTETNLALYTGIEFAAEQYAEFKTNTYSTFTAPSVFSLGVRVDPTGQTGWFLQATLNTDNTHTIELVSVRSDGSTVLASITKLNVLGTYRIAVVGQTAYAYLNGALIGSGTDPDGNASGAPAIQTQLNDQVSEAIRGVNFAAGTISTEFLNLVPTFDDTFNRANENPLNPTNWGSLSSPYHNLKIVSDQAEATTSNAFSAQYLLTPAPNDQYVQAEISAITNADLFLLLGRYDTVGLNGYVLQATNSELGPSVPAIILSQDIGGGTFANISTYFPESVSEGDVFAMAFVGSQVLVLHNNEVVINFTNTLFTSGNVGLGINPGATITSGGMVNFETGIPQILVSDAFSIPDCRNYGNFPNSAVDVNGTLLYVVPSVDSRAAGAPVDSRVSVPIPCGHYPQNSRA